MREDFLVICDPGPDPDDVKVIVTLGVLHKQRAVRLRGVIANGSQAPEDRAALAACVLTHVGVTGVPVGVGACGPAYEAKPHEFALEGYEAVNRAARLVDGAQLLMRLLRSARPRSLTVLCISSLRDLADAIASDPELVRRAVCRVGVQGGLERDASSQSGWAPDTAQNNVYDMDAARTVYDFCLLRAVPLTVVSRDCVPLLPMQLARSFAQRTHSPVLRYLADAQFLGLEGLWQKLCAGQLPARCTKQWFFQTFCGVSAEHFSRRRYELLGPDASILHHLNGFVKPYDVVALMAVLPQTRAHVLPEGAAFHSAAHPAAASRTPPLMSISLPISPARALRLSCASRSATGALELGVDGGAEAPPVPPRGMGCGSSAPTLGGYLSPSPCPSTAATSSCSASLSASANASGRPSPPPRHRGSRTADLPPLGAGLESAAPPVLEAQPSGGSSTVGGAAAAGAALDERHWLLLDPRHCVPESMVLVLLRDIYHAVSFAGAPAAPGERRRRRGEARGAGRAHTPPRARIGETAFRSARVASAGGAHAAFAACHELLGTQRTSGGTLSDLQICALLEAALSQARRAQKRLADAAVSVGAILFLLASAAAIADQAVAARRLASARAGAAEIVHLEIAHLARAPFYALPAVLGLQMVLVAMPPSDAAQSLARAACVSVGAAGAASCALGAWAMSARLALHRSAYSAAVLALAGGQLALAACVLASLGAHSARLWARTHELLGSLWRHVAAAIFAFALPSAAIFAVVAAAQTAGLHGAAPRRALLIADLGACALLAVAGALMLSSGRRAALQSWVARRIGARGELAALAPMIGFGSDEAVDVAGLVGHARHALCGVRLRRGCEGELRRWFGADGGVGAEGGGRDGRRRVGSPAQPLPTRAGVGAAAAAVPTSPQRSRVGSGGADARGAAIANAACGYTCRVPPRPAHAGQTTPLATSASGTPGGATPASLGTPACSTPAQRSRSPSTGPCSRQPSCPASRTPSGPNSRRGSYGTVPAASAVGALGRTREEGEGSGSKACSRKSSRSSSLSGASTIVGEAIAKMRSSAKLPGYGRPAAARGRAGGAAGAEEALGTDEEGGAERDDAEGDAGRAERGAPRARVRVRSPTRVSTLKSRMSAPARLRATRGTASDASPERPANGAAGGARADAAAGVRPGGGGAMHPCASMPASMGRGRASAAAGAAPPPDPSGTLPVSGSSIFEAFRSLHGGGGGGGGGSVGSGRSSAQLLSPGGGGRAPRGREGVDWRDQLPRVDAFVVHSEADDGGAKAAALAGWSRAFRAREGRSPVVWLDAACAPDGLPPHRLLAYTPVFLARSRSLLLLCGPQIVDSLWPVAQLYCWHAMGGSYRHVEVQVIGGDAATRLEAVAALDAFHVAIARASPLAAWGGGGWHGAGALGGGSGSRCSRLSHEQRSSVSSAGSSFRGASRLSRNLAKARRRLAHAVELSGAQLFNELVREYVPVVRAAAGATDDDAADGETDTDTCRDDDTPFDTELDDDDLSMCDEDDLLDELDGDAYARNTERDLEMQQMDAVIDVRVGVVRSACVPLPSTARASAPLLPRHPGPISRERPEPWSASLPGSSEPPVSSITRAAYSRHPQAAT